MAALQLTEAGARVLVLDAGIQLEFSQAPIKRAFATVISHAANSVRLNALPRPIISLGLKVMRSVGRLRQPTQSKCFAWAFDPLALVDDKDCPYVVDPGSSFDWFRSRQLGGRMLVHGHGCQYYRLSAKDIEAGASPWPFPAATLDPWYDQVEDRLELSGVADHSPFMADSRFHHTISPTPAEQDTQDRLQVRWPGMTAILGRFAPPLNSLELAAATGRLSVRQGAVVREVEVDKSGHVGGVQWVDAQSGRTERASARIVFLCASALESTRILMLSKTAGGEPGLGAGSGALGRYLMDHIVVSGEGVGPPLSQADAVADVRRCIYIPRFDQQSGGDDKRAAFNVQVYVQPNGEQGSQFTAVSFSEMRPRASSRVTLDPDRKDAWGIPVLRITAGYSEDEFAVAALQSKAIEDVAQALGVRLNRLTSTPPPPGTAMHECGTARMGVSPETSVLDPDAQCWDARGLYVTDAAAFPSQGIANPTLTIMALTARAVAHAMAAGR